MHEDSNIGFIWLSSCSVFFDKTKISTFKEVQVDYMTIAYPEFFIKKNNNGIGFIDINEF